MKLDEFLNKFGINEVPDAKRVGRSLFIVDMSTESFLKFRPVFIGECIAHERGEFLTPSIDFLQKIGRSAKNKIIVSKETEWLFICGRDLFGKSVLSNVGECEKGSWVVIMNKFDECLGFGEVINPLNSKGVVVKNLFDIGRPLRQKS